MARVIISAGHTQNEPGALKDDLREVDLTHKIATKITTRLRNKGIVTLSVPPELDLLQRIDWINKTGYKEETDDICIEIHINDGGKSGLEGWYKDKEENKSYELTLAIIEEACRVTELASQGVKSEYDHTLKTLAFLHNTNPTSSLIECLYIDSPTDQEFLRDDDRLDSLAEGIVKGILRFLGIEDLSDKVMQDKGSQSSMSPVPSTSPYPSTPIQSPSFPSYRPSSSYGMTQTPIITPQNREQRKTTIREKYQAILGRKVSEQDLNYFLNLGLSEDQMMKRLIGSQEHADMVKESQEYKKIQPKYEKLKVELKGVKTQLADKEKLIVQQNELIAQKNRTIEQLQKGSLAQADMQQTTSASSVKPISDTAYGYQEIVPSQESLLDKILRKLNDIFD